MFEEIAKVILGDVEFERLCPEVPAIRSRNKSFGWQGVKAWCEENGNRLKILMKGVAGRTLDLLIIHVDASMAHNVSAQHPCPPPSDTTDALRHVMISQWLKTKPLPPFVVLATPSKMTDTWILAILNSQTQNLECDFKVENRLVALGHFRKKQKQIKKPRTKYFPLTQKVAANINSVCQICTEADRFVKELKTASSTL